MVTIHLQVGVLVENSLSWTLLSLGLYRDLEANQGMIFHTSTCQLHRGKKSIQKGRLLFRLHDSKKGQTRTGNIG